MNQQQQALLVAAGWSQCSQPRSCLEQHAQHPAHHGLEHLGKSAAGPQGAVPSWQ
jgi:hypothetical protein